MFRKNIPNDPVLRWQVHVMKTMPPLIFWGVVLVINIFSTLLLLVLVRELDNARIEYTRFEPSVCTIKDKRITERHSGDSRTYCGEVLIEYERNGRKFETWTLKYDTIIGRGFHSTGSGRGRRSSETVRQWAENDIARFVRGETVPCWIDKDDPSQAIVVRKNNFYKAWFCLAFAWLLIFASLDTIRSRFHTHKIRSEIRRNYDNDPETWNKGRNLNCKLFLDDVNTGRSFIGKIFVIFLLLICIAFGFLLLEKGMGVFALVPAIIGLFLLYCLLPAKLPPVPRVEIDSLPIRLGERSKIMVEQEITGNLRSLKLVLRCHSTSIRGNGKYKSNKSEDVITLDIGEESFEPQTNIMFGEIEKRTLIMEIEIPKDALPSIYSVVGSISEYDEIRWLVDVDMELVNKSTTSYTYLLVVADASGRLEKLPPV